jgi:hypothetical protein
MSSIAEFFKELQRRSVIRAAIVHVLFFWVLVQVADVVLPYIGIVDDPVRWAILAGVGLFPVTLIVAWFFEHPWTHVTRGRVATDIILIILIGVGASTWVMRSLPQVRKSYIRERVSSSCRSRIPATRPRKACLAPSLPRSTAC